MNPVRIFAVFAAVITGFTSTSHALVAFASSTAFDAVYAGARIETWDTYANGTIIVSGGTLAGITYTSPNGSALVTNAYLPSTVPNGLGLVGKGYFAASEQITFSFAKPLVAFGIDINTFAIGNGAFRLTTNTGESVGSVYDPFGVDPNSGQLVGQFAGIASNNAFTSVTVTSLGTDYTLDTLRYVSAPDGGFTLLLLGSSLGLLLAVRRSMR